jgi:hypothetical protein
VAFAYSITQLDGKISYSPICVKTFSENQNDSNFLTFSPFLKRFNKEFQTEKTYKKRLVTRICGCSKVNCIQLKKNGEVFVISWSYGKGDPLAPRFFVAGRTAEGRGFTAVFLAGFTHP